jgi:hypothetical protein
MVDKRLVLGVYSSRNISAIVSGELGPLKTLSKGLEVSSPAETRGEEVFELYCC